MGDYIESSALPSTCFTCTRLNSTTFRIVEDDKYGEYPFIYAKLTPDALILIDTGCGGATKDLDIELTSLRKFLETYPIADNSNTPLNADGNKDYIVICSHCHYDHILGIEQFTKADQSRIWASSYSKSFLSEENLPTHSLCKYLDIPTPQYHITDWANEGVALSHRGEDLSLMLYQTPGHTPDELAVWDPKERVLFVGDSLYEWAPIIFPREGNLITFSESMGKLRRLVKTWNTDQEKKVTIACGHCTADADAEKLLKDVDAFLWDVVCDRVKVSREEQKRGEVYLLFETEDERLSFQGPRRLFEVFNRDVEAMEGLRRRVENDV
jgi:glyoxylase-like metal-dependent hydrolase (beta-lactamase superfamily II)